MLLSHPLQIASSRCFRLSAYSFPSTAGRFIRRVQTAEGEWAEEIPLNTLRHSIIHHTTPHSSGSLILNNSLGTLKRFNVITKYRQTTRPIVKRANRQSTADIIKNPRKIPGKKAFIASPQSHMHARHKRPS